MDFVSLVRFVASPEFVFWRRMILILCISILTILIGILANYFMRRSFHLFRIHRHKPAENNPGKTKFVFARRLVVALIYLLGIGVIIYLVPELRSMSYSIFAGAGLLAIIMGFAAQKAFADIISGIFLAVSQPIRVGDRVSIKDHYGIVEDITLRHTVIKTWDDNRVIIPNSVMNDAEILNYSITEETNLQTIDVQISYESDVEKAREILVDEVQKHPLYTSFLKEGEYLSNSDLAKVRVVDFLESGVKLRLYFWSKDKPTGFMMGCDVLESVKKRFEKAGIVIPYPHRVILAHNGSNKASNKKSANDVIKVKRRKK